MVSTALRPSVRRAWVTPTVTVDFPSPAAVGLMAVTRIKRPLRGRVARLSSRTLALCSP